jgi:hypothetical protein
LNPDSDFNGRTEARASRTILVWEAMEEWTMVIQLRVGSVMVKMGEGEWVLLCCICLELEMGEEKEVNVSTFPPSQSFSFFNFSSSAILDCVILPCLVVFYAFSFSMEEEIDELLCFNFNFFLVFGSN